MKAFYSTANGSRACHVSLPVAHLQLTLLITENEGANESCHQATKRRKIKQMMCRHALLRQLLTAESAVQKQFSLSSDNCRVFRLHPFNVMTPQYTTVKHHSVSLTLVSKVS